MNGIFTLGTNDLVKGLIAALFGGAVLPIAAAVTVPGFNLFTADWHSILLLAINGAVSAFGGYVVKNFFSDNQGRVFGKI